MVVVVLAINVKNYQYNPKKEKEKKNVPAQDELRLEPYPSSLPFLPLIDPSQLLLPLVLLVVVVIMFVLVVWWSWWSYGCQACSKGICNLK